MVSKLRLFYDPAQPTAAFSDNVGVFTKAGDGTAIGHVGDALKIYMANMPTVTPADNHAEGDAFVPGATGSFSLAVRNDANVAIGASGQYVPFQVDALGRLKVSDSIDFVAGVAVAADGVADAESPLKIGLHAVNAALVAAATGNKVNATSDVYRRQLANVSPQIATKGQKVTITDVPSQLPAIPGQVWLQVRNKDVLNSVWFGGDNTVSFDGQPNEGFELEKKEATDFLCGQFAQVWAVCSTGLSVDLQLFATA